MYNKNRRFSEDRGGSFAPVNIGDELDLKIEAVGEKGDGIAKIKGFVIFVPGAKQGEEVKVRITKVLRKVGFGEVVGAGSAKQEEEPEQDEKAENSDQEQDSEDSEDFGEEEK